MRLKTIDKDALGFRLHEAHREAQLVHVMELRTVTDKSRQEGLLSYGLQVLSLRLGNKKNQHENKYMKFTLYRYFS